MQILLDYLHLCHLLQLLVVFRHLFHLNHLHTPVSPRTCLEPHRHHHRRPNGRCLPTTMTKMMKNMTHTSTQRRDLAFQSALFQLEGLMQTLRKILMTICIRHLLHDHILFHRVRELAPLHFLVKRLLPLPLLRGLLHHHLVICLLHQPLEHHQENPSIYREPKDQVGDLRI